MIRHKHLIVYGGPLQDDDGKVVGSLIILDVPDRAALNHFLDYEPYARAGLFSEVRVHAMRQMVPEVPAGLFETGQGTPFARIERGCRLRSVGRLSLRRGPAET